VVQNPQGSFLQNGILMIQYRPLHILYPFQKVHVIVAVATDDMAVAGMPLSAIKDFK
jgi:hypothetical protein